MTTETKTKPRVRRTRAEIEARQVDEIVTALRRLNPDDLVALGQKLQAQAPRTTAALWDALSDRDGPVEARTISGSNFQIPPAKP